MEHRSSIPYDYLQILRIAGFFTNINEKFVAEVSRFLPDGSVVLCPMAGRGFLVKAFRDVGIPVLDSDDYSWNFYQGVENLEAVEALEKYTDLITHVVIAWAPAEDTVSSRLAKRAAELGIKII